MNNYFLKEKLKATHKFEFELCWIIKSHRKYFKILLGDSFEVVAHAKELFKMIRKPIVNIKVLFLEIRNLFISKFVNIDSIISSEFYMKIKTK